MNKNTYLTKRIVRGYIISYISTEVSKRTQALRKLKKLLNKILIGVTGVGISAVLIDLGIRSILAINNQ